MASVCPYPVSSEGGRSLGLSQLSMSSQSTTHSSKAQPAQNGFRAEPGGFTQEVCLYGGFENQTHNSDAHIPEQLNGTVQKSHEDKDEGFNRTLGSHQPSPTKGGPVLVGSKAGPVGGVTTPTIPHIHQHPEARQPQHPLVSLDSMCFKHIMALEAQSQFDQAGVGYAPQQQQQQYSTGTLPHSFERRQLYHSQHQATQLLQQQQYLATQMQQKRYLATQQQQQLDPTVIPRYYGAPRGMHPTNIIQQGAAAAQQRRPLTPSLIRDISTSTRNLSQGQYQVIPAYHDRNRSITMGNVRGIGNGTPMRPVSPATVTVNADTPASNMRLLGGQTRQIYPPPSATLYSATPQQSLYSSSAISGLQSGVGGGFPSLATTLSYGYTSLGSVGSPAVGTLASGRTDTSQSVTVHEPLSAVSKITSDFKGEPPCDITFPSTTRIKTEPVEDEVRGYLGGVLDSAYSPNTHTTFESNPCVSVSEVSLLPEEIFNSDNEVVVLDSNQFLREMFDIVYVCSFCGRRFKYESRLNKHLIVHSYERNFKCDKCGATFKVNSTLQTHLLTHSMDKPFKCDKCPSTQCTRSALKKHIEKKHGDSTDSYICNFCGEMLKTSQRLECHIRRHTGKNVLCVACGKLFYTVSHLKKHTARHHDLTPKEPGEIFECSHCSRTYTNKRSLQVHIMKVHLKEMPYECEECGLKFLLRHRLNYHMACHKQRKFWCHCKKSFVTKVGLDRHKLTHVNYRPYVCDMCGLTFTQKGSVLRHIVTSMRGRYFKRTGTCKPIAGREEYYLYHKNR